MDKDRVHAHATVSNVVCGFDCLGFALTSPFDTFELSKIDERTIRIVNKDDFYLSTDPTRNVAGVALQVMMDAAEVDFGVELVSSKTIKPGSGVGSSAASACGAVVALNALLDNRFSEIELVEFAMAGEQLASGTRHADNVAPCIFGGFVLVRAVDPIDIVRLDYPQLWITVIHPQIEIKTAEARSLLPLNVPLKDAVKQWSNLGAFVAALRTRDYELLGRSMEDFIVEPVRSKLIPSFQEIKDACMEAGAIGGGISGSGPSMFMLSETNETAFAVENAMHDVYSLTGIGFNTYVSPVDPTGVRLG
jgi:homoserine kinase